MFIKNVLLVCGSKCKCVCVDLCECLSVFAYILHVVWLWVSNILCWIVFLSMQSCTDGCVCVLCSQRTIEQLEAKHSDVRKQLVTVKEALSQLTLQKEVLEDEKGSLAQALSKVPHTHTHTNTVCSTHKHINTSLCIHNNMQTSKRIYCTHQNMSTSPTHS